MIKKLLLAFVVLFNSVIYSQGQSGTTLTSDVSCTPQITIEYKWTIDKSVTPETWNLFQGDQGTSEYTVTLTKDDGTLTASISGQVCITNGGAVPTENLTVYCELRNGVPPPNDLILTVPVDLSSMPVLDPGVSKCYDYVVNIPSANIYAGGSYKITSVITITNHSGSLGTPTGPSPSCTSVMPEPTLINNTVTVNDSYFGDLGQLSSDGSFNYFRTFSCDGDEGGHNNTATIVETGQSAAVSVTVNCYDLSISKDFSTSYTRTYDWTIMKSADQTELTLSTGQIFTVNYAVQVNATFTDSDFLVTGNITVSNPAPIDAVINSISDILSPDLAAAADCGITFPYTLAAGGTLNCTYSVAPPDAQARINTAAVSLQNYSYDKDLNSTPNGTTDFTTSVNVTFGDPTASVNECINVTDSFMGDLGAVCYADAPKTFLYSHDAGPYDVCGEYTVDNTAAITETGQTASLSIPVQVPCGGCSLTPGYWKTHSEYGHAPYDDTWALMPDGADTPFFLSGKSCYQVLWTSPSGNAYYILAHQYIAALLNQLNGADITAIQTELAASSVLFSTYTPLQISKLKGTSKLRMQFVSLSVTLDNYNNGLIGPGHCSEQIDIIAKENVTETGTENLLVETDMLPEEYSLNQNYPNPFNPTTTISFDLPEPSDVKITVYDITGRIVSTLINEFLPAGQYKYNWTIPDGLSSGIYLYRMETPNYSAAQRMIVLK